VYGNTFPSYLDKLTVLNTKRLRILQKNRTRCKESLYLQYSASLQLFNYRVLNFTHKAIFSAYLLLSIFQNDMYITDNIFI